MKSTAFEKARQTFTRFLSERMPNPDFESYYTEVLDVDASSAAPKADDAMHDYEAMLHAQLMGFTSGH